MAKLQCKWCGTSTSSISSLTANLCSRHPNKGRHELYEGSEKSKYICKYCGMSASSISTLTANNCSRHPNKGKHEPAL
jgi:hypothetical protein